MAKAESSEASMQCPRCVKYTRSAIGVASISSKITRNNSAHVRVLETFRTIVLPSNDTKQTSRIALISSLFRFLFFVRLSFRLFALLSDV